MHKIMQTKLPELPSVVLSNGLRVANYSSPHPFTFTDGSVLPACSSARAKMTLLDARETELPREIRGIKITDVVIDWKLTWFLEQEVDNFVYAQYHKDFPWDIILVPLPFMVAVKKYIDQSFKDAGTPPFRVIRVADRLTKEIHIDKFCV